MTTKKNTVLVWRWTLLPSSETFIRNQMVSYSSWKPIAVGAVALETVNSAPDDRIIFSKRIWGRAQKAFFRVTDLSLNLPKTIDSISPQVVHAHFAIDGMRMRAVAKRREIPLVVTLHGSDITSSPSKPGIRGYRYRLRLKKLFRDANTFIAVSDHIARAAVALGADRSKITVLPLGVPWKPAPDDTLSRKNIVFIGRLVEKKGLEYLLEALALVSRGGINGHRLTVIGDGPLREDLEARSDELGLPADFLGFLEPEEVHKHLEQAVCVAVPSVTGRDGDTEGLPTVVFEAFRASTPVVGFHHAGIPEAVRHGYSGLLTEERDIHGLAVAVGHLLTKESETRQLGRNARAAFEERYEIRDQTKKLEAVYERLISRDS
ncbi:glycosyltransferase [Glutamicibacter arilaitensis]|uniref:glycosyltransferase n=1 Tax=Glutamicibacter arilaitensis TaxID=256701 RepID=UPI003FCF9CBD